MAEKFLLDGEDITGLEPERRPVSTVFQSYALFPHMTVLQNVMYGLKFRGMKRKRRQNVPTDTWILWGSLIGAMGLSRSSPEASSREWPWPGRWP